MLKSTAGRKALKTDTLSSVPIFDLNVEKAVLKCLLFSKDLSLNIYKLSEEDFYSLEHQKIFRLFKKIMEKNYELDPVLIQTEQRNSAFIDILTCDVILANWKNYFNRLKEISALRKIEGICYRATVQVEERKPISSIKNYILTEISEVKGKIADGEETDVIDEEFEKIIEDTSLIAVRTGFPKLDSYIKGFLRSSFNVIASYPRCGKTTLILNLIDNICRIQKKSVLFVSLEMDYIELHAKLVSLLSGVPFDTVVFGNLKDRDDEEKGRDWIKIQNARAEISKWKLYRMGEEETTPADIEMKLKDNKVDVVFIDYLQLMKPNMPGKSIREDIANLSRELKQVARRTGIPIVAVSSINRQYSNRDDKKPRLSDLKETSQIEYDAGLVLMLHRESLFRDWDGEKDEMTPEEFEKHLELLISKSRFSVDNVIVDFWFNGENSWIGEQDILNVNKQKEV